MRVRAALLSAYAATQPNIPVRDMPVVLRAYVEALVAVNEATCGQLWGGEIGMRVVEQRERGNCVHMVALGALTNLLLHRSWMNLQCKPDICMMHMVQQMSAAAGWEQARRDRLCEVVVTEPYEDQVKPGYTITVRVGGPSPLAPKVVAEAGAPQVKLLLLQLLGAGGFCSVWLCKPLGLDAWRAALGLAPDAALPRQLDVKVPVTSGQARRGVTPHDCSDWCLGGDDDDEREKNGHREAQFLEMLGAVPYVADLLLVGRSVLLVPPTPGAGLKQVDLPVLVMEAALLGTLHDALHNRGPLAYLDVPLFPFGMMPEKLAKYYALHVLAALVAQWASGAVIHRDLKGGNILNTI